jgi:hypothetical protein
MFRCEQSDILRQALQGVRSRNLSARLRGEAGLSAHRILERKLHSSSVWIYMWLFFEPADERARPWQSYVKVVDTEEQEEAVARLGVVGTCQ